MSLLGDPSADRPSSRRRWPVGALFLGAVLLLLLRTGLLGLVLLAMLVATTLPLYALGRAITRRHKALSRPVARWAARALGVLMTAASLGAAAYGLVTIVRFAGDRADLPIKDRYVAVIVVDGASLIQARELLFKGLDDPNQYASQVSRSYPNISRYFLQGGAFTACGLSVWPSSSIPAHTGIVTGCYPRRTGIMGMRQFDPRTRRHTSYIGLGILRHQHLLSPEVPTLNQYFHDVRSLDILQVANRGSSLFLPGLPHDEMAVDLWERVFGFTDFVGRFSGRTEMPRIVIVTLPDVDHETHNALLSDEKSVKLYLKADEHVGRIFDLYKRKGLYEKTLFVLCADHAMGEVRNHVTIDNLMRDMRFQTFESLKWSVVPAWGSFEANFYVGARRRFDNDYEAVPLWGGNSDALIYIKGQEREASGEVARQGWDIRATDEMLADYRIGGTHIDVIRRLLDYSPGIGLVFTNPSPGTYHVYSREGQGRLRERMVGDETEFQYTVVKGRDPLEYERNPSLAPAVRGGTWLSDEHWLALTFLEHYPDGLRRMASSFGHPCSATLHVVAADGWDFTPYYVARHVLVGSHGSLNRQQSTVPIMFHGPGVRHVELAYGRTVDIVPTILAYFGVEGAELDGRALPIFADTERNRRVADAGQSRFALDQVEDARYTYTLQGYYGEYDRSLLRTDKRTQQTEVLVESVRSALPALQAKPNATLRLTGIRGPYLLLKTEYLGEQRPGTQVRYHIGQRRLE